LLRQLADTIYQEDHAAGAEESKEEVMKYAPEMALKQSSALTVKNPTEICLIYLREKIAQS
jgi:hypothetical protein